MNIFPTKRVCRTLESYEIWGPRQTSVIKAFENNGDYGDQKFPASTCAMRTILPFHMFTTLTTNTEIDAKFVLTSVHKMMWLNLHHDLVLICS